MKIIFYFLIIVGVCIFFLSCANKPVCKIVCRPSLTNTCEKVCRTDWDE